MSKDNRGAADRLALKAAISRFTTKAAIEKGVEQIDQFLDTIDHDQVSTTQ